MFTPVHMRSANAYRTVGVETLVAGADAHQLVALLYEALLQALNSTKHALQTKDIATKCKAIGRAVRLIEEGLKAGLNDAQGGELALHLRNLYDYCIVRLSEANLKSDEAMVDEVLGLIQPLAQAWTQIRPEVMNSPHHAVPTGG
jgi:flagellar secretion chaperone FliS